MDVGVEFSHYRVIEHIGRGGMADVWSARDKRLSRTVAIKTIARDLSQELDPVKLFEREAQTIAALEHPHILPIYEFGEFGGQLFIVMRYVSGGSLEDILEKGPMSLEETMRVARAVGQALDYAHNSKVIHLDLKPSNILLDSYQSPYLADFGLATMVGPEGRAANPGSGTLLYMAPEQLTSEHLDFRADIYSFGILIFHMVTGQLPFDATVPLALRQLQMREDIPTVESVRPGLPSTLNTMLRRATALEPLKRQDSLRELLQNLEGIVTPGRVPISLDTARAGTSGETSPAVNISLDQLITGPIEGLVSRPLDPLVKPQETSGGLDIDKLITGPVEGLISRPSVNPASVDTGEGLISRRLDTASAPREPEHITEIKIDLSDLNVREMTPEEMALREVVDIYTRARRAWARGQGKFILGVTDFILIADYYRQAEVHKLELDDAGMQMLLRGALEYDHDVDYWWEQVSEESRRWTALHALRSENAPARVRALERLADVPDSDTPQIPRQVAQALQVETNGEVQLAALRVLEHRAKLMPQWVLPSEAGRTTTIKLVTALRLTTAIEEWREVVFSLDIDHLLAQKALDVGNPQVAELAARVIGRIRSTAAVRLIAEREGERAPGALRALALVRDEAPSLPSAVSTRGRAYAWLANTWRRLSDRPLATVLRFVAAFIGATLAFGGYVWVNFSSALGASLNLPDVWGRTVSIGLTIGIFMGIVVLFAGEIADRLHGFWTWWARLIVAALFGFLLTTFTWGAFDFLVLNDPNLAWNVIAWSGVGAAIGFGITGVYRLPGIIQAIILGLSFYLPLYFVWDVYWNQGTLPVAIIYFREYSEVFTILIPMIVLIAVGMSLQAIVRDVRWLAAWLRSRRGS
jgi:serine/threonine-protein kinase